MKIEPSEPPDSEGAALVRLGLKLGLGERGEYLAEYLDQRRVRRVAIRLKQLGEMAEGEGLSAEALLERVQENDDAAEFVDEVVDVASRARYEPTLKYLARCLATALAFGEDAVLDMDWVKLRAVRDVESVHVCLLHMVKATQDRRAAAVSRRQLFKTEPEPQRPAAESDLVEIERRSAGGLPESCFHAVMAVLIRNGLVATEQDVDVEVEVELDIELAEANASPSTAAETRYRVTGLGLELLDDISEAGQL